MGCKLIELQKVGQFEDARTNVAPAEKRWADRVLETEGNTVRLKLPPTSGFESGSVDRSGCPNEARAVVLRKSSGPGKAPPGRVAGRALPSGPVRRE